MAIVAVTRWETPVDGMLVYFDNPAEAAEYLTPGQSSHPGTYLELHCDTCAGRYDQLFETPEQAHQVAHDSGWTRPDGTHQCPRCYQSRPEQQAARQLAELEDLTLTDITQNARDALCQLLDWATPADLFALVAEVLDTHPTTTG